MLEKAVDVANRVVADISVMSVALDGESEKEANENVSEAIKKLKGLTWIHFDDGHRRRRGLRELTRQSCQQSGMNLRQQHRRN